MKYYYRVTTLGVPIPGSNFKSNKKPQGNYFRELIPKYKYCCNTDLEQPSSAGDRNKYYVRLNEENAPISGTLRRMSGRVSKEMYQEVFKDNCCPIISITIVPDTSSILIGATQKYTVIGNYASGKTKTITSLSTFESSATGVATITDNIATGVSVGSSNITATYGTMTDIATLTITAPAGIVSVTVTPATDSITTAQTSQLTATVVVTGGAAQTVTWTSSDESVATVNTSGLVTPVIAGTVTITATSTVDNTKSDTSVITITT